MKKFLVIYRNTSGRECSRRTSARSRDEAAAKVRDRVANYAGLLYVKEVK